MKRIVLVGVYVYDALSRRTNLAYGNGTSQSFTYSTGGDLLTQAHSLSGTSNTWTNTYTKAHQLLSEAASNASWQYVPAVFETTNYSAANNLNQYVTVTQGANPTVTLFYDANGNLTADGTWTFAYDAENRLRTAAKSSTTATYLYDPLGRRQAKIVNSVTTSFFSDGDEEIAEYDGSGGLLRRYVPGPGTDQPIAMVTVSGATLVHAYFHVNRQGSTVAMSNDSGTVSEGPYTYDAYGQGAPLTGVPFKYTGRRLDAETGLYYYRARYYSASLGRFLQTDPIGYRDQINLYGYVGNDPLNASDPSGKCPWCIVGAIAGAVIGGAVSAVVNVGAQMATHPGGKIDYKQVAVAAGGGAIAGAIAGGTMGAAAAAEAAGTVVAPAIAAFADSKIVAATISAASSAVDDIAHGKPVSALKAVAAAGVSAIVGTVVKPLTSVVAGQAVNASTQANNEAAAGLVSGTVAGSMLEGAVSPPVTDATESAATDVSQMPERYGRAAGNEVDPRSSNPN